MLSYLPKLNDDDKRVLNWWIVGLGQGNPKVTIEMLALTNIKKFKELADKYHAEIAGSGNDWQPEKTLSERTYKKLFECP